MVTNDVKKNINKKKIIIVLSRRPSMIKKIYNINLANKKDPISNRLNKDYNLYCNKIWNDLDVI